MFPFFLLVTTGYIVDTCGYLVVTSGYLIDASGYFWLLFVTSCYFWFLILLTTIKELPGANNFCGVSFTLKFQKEVLHVLSFELLWKKTFRNVIKGTDPGI